MGRTTARNIDRLAALIVLLTSSNAAALVALLLLEMSDPRPSTADL